MLYVTEMIVIGLHPKNAQGSEALRTIRHQGQEFETRLIVADTFDEATTFIAEYSTLDIVHIRNEGVYSHLQLAQGCRRIAEFLRSHENKPWINFFEPRSFSFLHCAFQSRGVYIHPGRFDEAVIARIEYMLTPAEVG